MRINTNIPAMSTLRQLGNSSRMFGRSVGRLSSGFRINRAADDAAGLGIANGLRADIRATRQAARNTEQGNSVLQVMEGGAQQVSQILDRMKELAAQAASDSVDSQARVTLNNEFDELSAEVDRIVNTTKFQGQSLLDGTYGSAASTANEFDTTIANNLADIQGVSVDVRNASTFNGLAAGNITATVTQVDGTIESESLATVSGLTGTASISTQANFNTLSESTYTVNKSGSAIQLLDGNNTVVESVDVSLNVAGGDVVFANAGITITGDGANDVNAAADGVIGTITVDQSFTFELADASGATQSLTLDADGSSQKLNFTNFGVEIAIDAGQNSVTFDIGTNNTLTIAQADVSQAQFLVSASGDYTSNDLVLLDAVNLSAQKLGVTTSAVDLTTATGAQAALASIDTAIDKLSDTFSAIGAAQNRLDFAFANAESMVENLSAAESVIRDVDMAAEVTQMTKFQILQQAGTAMLGQANAAPQGVLRLLG
ncbi:MAG: flagellin [Gemmatimonadota bacterium]|nr:flagellin [Gemmatimonadota bacterium]MDH5758205.1 flagellin [Gemmatimonadota bacterium]